MWGENMALPEQYREEKKSAILVESLPPIPKISPLQEQYKNSIYYLLCLFICYVGTYRILANKFDISVSVKCKHFKLV